MASAARAIRKQGKKELENINKINILQINPIMDLRCFLKLSV